MKPIIDIQNLGKQYRLGARAERYSTIRETVVNAARRPMNALRGRSDAAHNKFWALRDINYRIMPGEVVGVIGRNGAGKSTLLKILSRITEPTTGRVELYGRVGSLLEIGTGFHPELTGRENIYLNGAILGMRRDEIARKFDEIVDFAEFEEFLDTPVKRYSSGMYMRLAFAVAAHLESEILVVDEVLAVGDDEFQKKCLGKMERVANQGRTVLFVSHNMTAVSKLCASAIFLERGELAFAGATADTIRRYLDRNEGDKVEFENAVIKRASIREIDGELELSADYEVDRELKVPCLGFVISDGFGTPIFGSNPVLDNQRPVGQARRSGTVVTRIKSPALISGSYMVSLWFGDGRTDFFSEKDCLSFDIVNPARKQMPLSLVGSVVPGCEWSFK